MVSKVKQKSDKLFNRYDYLCREKKLLEQLKEFGNEYHFLVNKADRTSSEQKRLEELYHEFLPNGFIGRGNYGDPDWVQKQIRTCLHKLKSTQQGL